MYVQQYVGLTQCYSSLMPQNRQDYYKIRSRGGDYTHRFDN
tara:strand:- start:3937 stop:4059 length:123 start_codon:yes stop_codon:yes gene_type:complete